MESIINNNEETNKEYNKENNNSSNTSKDINDDVIINLLRKYISTHNPLFSESYNDLYNPIEDTYIIEIKSLVRPRIIEVLNMLQFRNKSYLSYDEKAIHGLSYKSYAFYKEQKIENNATQFVFCLEDDKHCKGILLSFKFNN